MNKYADFSNRNHLSPQSSFPNLSESRLRSPKFSLARMREISPVLDFSRNHTTGISGLAMTQNMILSSFSDRLQTEESHLKLPELNIKSVTNKDFNHLIEKLDEVTSPRAYAAEIHIHEGITSEYSLQSESIQVFKIPSKDKKCPLTIKVKVFHGHIQSLVSLIELKTISTVHFRSSKSNFHELYDIRSDFTTEFCYIYVRASSNSNIKILSEFGKNKFASDFKTYEKISLLDNSEESWNENFGLKKKNGKNFVKENKELKGGKGAEVQRSEVWRVKREMVVLRRKKHEKAKKKKVVEVLNKRIKRLEEEAMGHERATQRQKLLKFCREWMEILFVAKSALFLKDLVRIKRNEFFQKIKMSRKVCLIQQFYKLHLQPRTNAKATAADSLLYFRGIFKMTEKLKMEKSICTFMANSARKNMLFHIFASFGEKVYVLQRAYRRYLKKKNFRMATLRIQWNKCIDRNMYSKKNSTARKRESVKYISLPHTTRDSILKDFYHERWKHFEADIKLYSKLVREQKSTPFQKLPEFKYIPSDVIMEGMIRNAICRSKEKF